MAPSTRSESQKIISLISSYMLGNITPAEMKELDQWKNSSEKNNQLLQELIEEDNRSRAVHKMQSYHTEDRLASIKNIIHYGTSKKSQTRRLYWYGGIAASLFLVSTIGLYLNYNKDNSQHTAQIISDILPGRDKAVLTLSNGTRINLDKAKNGQLVDQYGIITTKTTEGFVTYSGAESSTSVHAFNTIETPRGGEFRIQLPDGTKVWLNAASSLRYPLSFGALKERRVELTGEAYFEVTHNKAQPFRVVTDRQTVEVLGTHFNVNSYADEKKTTTTLEEGSVRVIAGALAKTIRPGEQVLLSPNGDISIQDADLQTVLAWKNGKIYFKDADIQTIMRLVSRWYNIEVEYRGDIPKDLFNGGVSRTANLSSLLKILELNNIHFKIESTDGTRKLVVTP